jgi:nucleoside-diphosphate-sugar epimerase
MKNTSLISRFRQDAMEKRPLMLYSGGHEQYDMVEAGDVAEFILRACEREVSGIFHVGTGRALSVREIAEIVNRVFENDAGVESAMSASPMVPSRGFAPLSMEKTQRALEWKACDLETGLRRLKA